MIISPDFADLLNAVLCSDAQSLTSIKKPSYYATRTRILQFHCSDESNIAALIKTDTLDIQQVCEIIAEQLKYNWTEKFNFSKKNDSLQNFAINREQTYV